MATNHFSLVTGASLVLPLHVAEHLRVFDEPFDIPLAHGERQASFLRILQAAQIGQ